MIEERCLPTTTGGGGGGGGGVGRVVDVDIVFV